MDKFKLIELYKIKSRLDTSEDGDLLSEVNEAIKRKENALLETSATGGPASGGMGAVVSAQPSGLAGQTIGTNWASNGGSSGSGDISAPYNPSGSNRVFQKIKAPMGKGHGAMTGKKSRNKKMNLKDIKKMMSKSKEFKPKGGVMKFNDFLKNDFTSIKK